MFIYVENYIISFFFKCSQPNLQVVKKYEPKKGSDFGHIQGHNIGMHEIHEGLEERPCDRPKKTREDDSKTQSLSTHRPSFSLKEGLRTLYIDSY